MMSVDYTMDMIYSIFLLLYIAVQLIYVAIIGEVLILIFSVIAFAFLHDYFENENQLFCSTLWECFVTVTRDGWLSTIGTVSKFIFITKLFSRIVYGLIYRVVPRISNPICCNNHIGFRV